MVELAIVLPVLLLVMFAIAEFSVAFLRWQAVSNAAREGARAAAVFRPNCAATVGAAVDDAVAQVLSSANLPPATPTLGGTLCAPGSAQVTVTVPYQFQILPNLASGIGDIDLTATSVMRNEFPVVVTGG